MVITNPPSPLLPCLFASCVLCNPSSSSRHGAFLDQTLECSSCVYLLLNQLFFLFVECMNVCAASQVDPISALGELAEEHDLPLHVDAGCGGFMLVRVFEVLFCFCVFFSCYFESTITCYFNLENLSNLPLHVDALNILVIGTISRWHVLANK